MKDSKPKRVSRPTSPTFASPLTQSWWRSALEELSDVRKLVVSALLSAVAVVMSMLVIPLAGGSIRVMFTFTVSSLNAMICGPFVGLIWGAVTDIVAFFAFGDGGFFPGYTLSEMLIALIFALSLYRRPIGFYRILAARAVINVFVNAGLGSLWIVLMGWTTKAYPLQFGLSLVKNIALLPLETAVIMLLFYSLYPVLVSMKLIPKGERRALRRRDVIIAALVSAALLVAAVFSYLYVNWYYGK